MGGLTGHRATQEGLNAGGASSLNNNKKRWSNLMPLIVALVVFAEIAFLGRLDMAKNAAMVNTWTESFYYGSPGEVSISEEDAIEELGHEDSKSHPKAGTCVDWLEKQDAVVNSRDFRKKPIWVSGAEQEWNSCAVGCKFGHNPSKRPDAAFGLFKEAGTSSVLRSMESAQYYAENNIAQARRRGYSVIMTTSLSSDVPVGYFSWAEYDIMAPLQPKTESALAAAFISNCGAYNFRLQALEMMEKSNIKIDSYGGCHQNRDGRGIFSHLCHHRRLLLQSVPPPQASTFSQMLPTGSDGLSFMLFRGRSLVRWQVSCPKSVDKVEALKHYKFSVAFENSNEEDYVTEKFFQSLVAGAVPVVVGAPNIMDFAPSPDSVLHIKELDDIPSVAKTMLHLAESPEAYNQSVRWKYDGPSDSFKALVDMAAVHSSCRLCIHLATKIHEIEENGPEFQKRPCKCTRGSETVYHLYVRERGRFEMDSIFLRSSNLSLEAVESAVLAKFKSANHVPIWKEERPKSIRGGDELKVYRIYPIGLTQREALYTFRFNGNEDFRSYIESKPCAKFEVIFV